MSSVFVVTHVDEDRETYVDGVFASRDAVSRWMDRHGHEADADQPGVFWYGNPRRHHHFGSIWNLFEAREYPVED